MKAALSLRALEPRRCAMNNARLAQGWRDEILVDFLAPDTLYLELESRLDDKPCMAWLPLQRAVDFWLGNSATPAEQIGPDLALAFARDAFDELGLPAAIDILKWARLKEIVDGGLDRKPRYRVTGASVELFIDRLPQPRTAPTFSLPDLSIRVQQRFGPVDLNANDIAQLEVGDVVVLDRSQGQLVACGQALFNLNIQGKLIMLTQPDDDLAYAAPIEGPDNDRAEAAPALGQLPVPVSFVLANSSMPLSQLAALRPGIALPIADGAPIVTLSAGGQTIARGELVRLGSALAVEITEVMTLSDSIVPGASE